LPGPLAFRGQILIVGYVTRWSDPSEHELARLRAELRSVSASLVLIGPDEMLRFQSDDGIRSDSSRPVCEREDFDLLLAPLSRPGHIEARHLLRLVIVNPSGAITWSHDGAAPRAPIAALISALSQARRHLLAGPGRIYGITRAELIGSLTSAFAAIFGNSHPLGSLAPTEHEPVMNAIASGERR
jgi:hypothetical protein